MSSGSSSSGSSCGGKYSHHTAVFYSPSRFNKYSGNHSGTIHHVHPGLSPMMHHDFLNRSRQQQRQQHHFTTAGRGGGASKRSGGGGGGGSAVDLFV